MGLTASTGLYTQDVEISNWKVQLVVPSPSSSSAQLSASSSAAIRTNEYFSIDLFVKDACGNRYVPTERDSINDVSWILDTSSNCKLMSVSLGPQSGFSQSGATYLVNFECSQVGQKTFQLTYKGKAVTGIVTATVTANVMTRVKTNIQTLIDNNQLPNIDTGFDFKLTPEDTGENLAQTTAQEILNQISVVWANPADSRTDHVVTKNADGTYNFHINTDKACAYNISSSLFVNEIQGGYYILNATHGAPNANNSYIMIYDSNEANNARPFTTLNITAGQNATAYIYLKDRLNNSVDSGSYKDKLTIQLWEQGVPKILDTSYLNVDMYSMNLRYQMTKKGVNMFQVTLGRNTLTCLNCIFAINPTESVFANADLFIWSDAMNNYVQSTDPQFKVNKGAKFNFLLVLKDKYSNVLDRIDSTNYKGTLSGNNMNVLNLALSRYTSAGVQVQIADADLSYYNNLIGKTNYAITINEISSNGVRKFPLTIVSDGSDSDGSNAPYDPIRTQITWAVAPLNNKCLVGAVYRVAIKLISKDGLRYNNWIDESLIVPTLDIYFPGAFPNETIYPLRRDLKPGMYLMDLVIKKVTGKLRTLSYKVNGTSVLTKLRFYELAGDPSQAFVDNLFDSTNRIMNPATVLRKYTFTYTLFDQFMNPVDPTSGSLDLVLRSVTQPNLISFKPDCQANGVGNYPCSITPNLAGDFTLNSGMFSSPYKLSVKMGSPDASFTEGSIVNDVTQHILAGTNIVFRMLVRDSQGSQLGADDVNKVIGNFAVNLQFVEGNTLENLPLSTSNVLASGEIRTNRTITKTGHYKFLPSYNSQDVKCQICAVNIEPNLVDVSKVQISLLQGDSKSLLIENSNLRLDNNRIVPIFLMEFFDTYSNPRPVESNFSDFTGNLAVPGSDQKAYTFNGSNYMGNILFQMSPESLKPKYQVELANNNCNLSFTGLSILDQRRIFKSFAASLNGSDFDNQFTYDDPDPNNVLIIPNKVQSIAGQFISVSVELRAKNGLLFFDQANGGFYAPGTTPFQLIPTGETASFANIQVSHGKLNGTYVLTFNVTKTYTSVSVYLYFAQHDSLTNMIKATNPLVLTVVPDAANYVVVQDETGLTADCKADTRKVTNLQVFDRYANLIINGDIATLSLGFIQDNSTSVPISNPTSNGVQCSILCKKAGTVSFLSLGFRNKVSLALVPSYSFKIVAGEPDHLQSQATLSASVVNASDPLQWRIFLIDTYGNKIDASKATLTQFWSSVLAPNALSTQNLSGLAVSSDGSYLYYPVQYDVAGNYRFSAYLLGLPIFSSNFMLTVLALQADWSFSKLALLDVTSNKFNEWEGVSDNATLTQSIFSYPEFVIHLYDSKGNVASSIPSDWSLGLNLSHSDFADKPIAFCPKSGSANGFVMCNDKTLQNPLVEKTPKQRWDDLVQNRTYQMLIGNQGNFKLGGLLNVTGNDSDSGTSNLDVDIKNTVILPFGTLTTTAGVSISFTIELRTTNKNLRPNWFFDNPMANLSLAFKYDTTNTNILRYTIVKGDVHGRYVATLTSFKTYALTDPNIITVSINNAAFTGYTPSLVVTPGAIAKVQPYDTVAAVLLTKLPDSNTDNLYTVNFRAFDAWNNDRPILDSDVVDIHLLDSQNNTLIFQTKLSSTGLLISSFQPQTADTYTYTLALGGNFTFKIAEGSPYFANCLASVNVSADQSVVAGSTVEVSVSFYDKFNNKITLSIDFLSTLFVKYFYKRPDVAEGYIVGTSIAALLGSNSNSITFKEVVTVKGIYNFKVQMKNQDIPMKQSTVKVTPAAVNLTMSNLRYFDTDASRYILMSVSNAIREDNLHTYPTFLLELCDSYSNTYDVFPTELVNQKVNVTLFGNSIPVTAPVNFNANSLIGNSLFINLTDGGNKALYRDAVYRKDPYSLKLSLLTTLENVTYPVILLGEGTNDTDADSGQDLNLTLTVFSKDTLSFRAGEYDSFVIELRDVNNKRKVDVAPVRFGYSFQQADGLSDGNYFAFEIPGDLRGRYLITVNGTKATKKGATKLTISINGTAITKTVAVNVLPNVLTQIQIPTDLSVVGTTDANYLFDVYPYDQYMNIVDVQESDVNLQIKYPSNRSTYQTTKDLTLGKLGYSVLCRDAGIYLIQSSLLSSPKNFTVVAGTPSSDTSSVFVTPLNLTVGQSVSVSIIVADANNNRIYPSKTPTLASQIQVQVQSTSNAATYNVTADTTKESLTTSFTSTVSGMVTVTALINGKAILCDSCSVVFNPGPLDLSKTKFLTHMTSDSFIQTTNIQIPYGSSRVSFIGYLFDTYGNSISGTADSETFTMTLSGNYINPVFPFTIVKQSPNILLFDLSSSDLARVVPSSNYSLNLIYFVSAVSKASYNLTLQIIGDDNGAGNGPWAFVRINPVPTLTLTAGVEGFFDVVFYTAQNKRFNGIIDVTLVKIYDNSVLALTSNETLGMAAYAGDVNGKIRLGFLGKIAIPREQQRNISFTYNGKKIEQDLFVFIVPNVPDLSHTQVTKGLPDSCISGIQQIVQLRFFDTYLNPYPTASLTTQLVPQAQVGNATFGAASSQDQYFLTVPITPIYPPSTLSVMLYFQQSANIVYPLISLPLTTSVKTYLDPNKTEIIGTSLPGIQTNEEFKYYVLLKDKAGYCFEDSRNVLVNFTGPLGSPSISSFTDTPQYFDANQTGLLLPSNGSNYACQKLYYGDLPAGNFTKAGYYQIDVYIIGENGNQPVKTINYTLIRPGPTDPSKSILSIPSLLNRGRVPLDLEVNTPLIFKLQLADSFGNIVTEYRKTDKITVSLPDFDSSAYNFPIANKSDGSYSLNMTVVKTGTIKSVNLTVNGFSLDFTSMYKFDVPDSISITPGPCFSDSVQIENEVFLTQTATVGELTTFKLTCRDFFGNRITKGGSKDDFQTLMSGSNLETVGVDYASTSISDNNDGTYQYQFVAAWAGNYTVTIQFGGDPIGKGFNIGVKRCHCPSSDLPVWCENLGACKSNYLNCAFDIFKGCSDPSAPYNCTVNGQSKCVSAWTECDCPTGYAKCPADNKCVPELLTGVLCSNPSPMDCPPEFPAYCAASGTCRLTPELCPSQPGCPPTFHLCADQTCSEQCKDFPEAEYDCQLPTPWKCEDQTCVFDPRDCPTRTTCNVNGFYICPDGSCVPNEVYCRAPAKCEGLVLCPDQSCRPSKEDCPKSITCPWGYALCEDKTCKADCGVSSRRILAKIGKTNRYLSDNSSNYNSSCPAGYIVCPGGECVTSRFLCPSVKNCGANKRVCPDFSCAGPDEKCIVKSCSQDETLCWDGKCVSDSSLCSTRTTCPTEHPIKCGDGSCANKTTDCPPDIMCPAYYPYRCATGECRANAQECPTLITCPENKPIQCTDGSCVVSPFKCKEKAELRKCDTGLILCPDGSCALSKLLCPPIASCNPSQIRCWDNTCVNSLSECDKLEATRDICPDDRKLRCPDGSCRAALKDCPTQLICPITRPVKCDDGTCKQSVKECAVGTECGYGLKRCPDGSCTGNENLCGTPVTCSKEAPYVCFDSTCKKDPRDCPLPPDCPRESPILCPDGTCTSQRVNCKRLAKCDSKTPVRCPNMNCYASVDDCKPIDGCPAGKIMCEDGSCASYISYCPAASCPKHLPVQCVDGMCVSNATLCDKSNGCPYSKPFKCPNGTCTHKASLCDTNTSNLCVNLTLCPDGSCASDQAYCPNVFGCPPETPRLCANGECIDPHKGNCPVVSCPKETPVKCIDGTCQKSITNCPSYFTGFDISQCIGDPAGNIIPCADGRCVPSPDLCRPLSPCASGKVRCGDGSCRANAALCPTNNNTCPSVKPVRCQIGACASNLTDCPVDNGCPNSKPVKCPLTGSCVLKNDDCTDASNKTILLNKCTMLFPIRCENGTCVTKDSDCNATSTSCAANEIQCPNGLCVANKSLCTKSCSSSYVTCPDGTCKKDSTKCLADNGCPLHTPFRCTDGSCKSSPLSINGEDGCMPNLVCPDYKPYLCSNGECMGSPSQCQVQKPCPSDKNYTCPDYNCVSSPDQCPQQTLCPAATPVQCGSGQCAKTAMECTSRSTMYCPDEKPVLCASGRCEQFAWKCTDSDTRQGKHSTSRRLLVEASNGTATPVVCSDGSFRNSVGSCVIIPSCPPGQYRCNSSLCVDRLQDCTTTDDQLEPCVAGTQRCLDGICRSECLNYQGCPFNKSYHCGNGLCARNEGECAGDSVCEIGFFRCIDNTCVQSSKQCPMPLRNYPAEQLKLTVSALMTSSVNFIQQGSSSVRLATLTIPSGSLLPIIQPNSTNSSTPTFATLPQLGLMITPIAQNQITDYTTSIDPTRVEYVGKIFPYNSGVLPFHQTVRSPVVQLTALNRGDGNYNFQLVLDIQADVLVNTTKASDYCLATINTYTKSWECVNRTLLNPEDTSGVFSYSVPQDGVYSVVFNPAEQKDNVEGEPCGWFCQNKMTIVYVFIAIIVAGLIGSYIIWRVSRYVNKYREAKRQMANFRDQISEMEKAKTDVVGQTLRDKIEGISFTTNPAFRKESSASKFSYFSEKKSYNFNFNSCQRKRKEIIGVDQ